MLAPLSFMINGKQYVVALYAGTTNYYVLPGSIAGGRSAPAKAGDNITLYGIGFGPVTPDTPAGQVVQGQSTLQNTLQVSFGGVAAKVTYKGLTPGYLGLYQFNVVVPNVPLRSSHSGYVYFERDRRPSDPVYRRSVILKNGHPRF